MNTLLKSEKPFIEYKYIKIKQIDGFYIVWRIYVKDKWWNKWRIYYNTLYGNDLVHFMIKNLKKSYYNFYDA